jgi:Tfp pilus assembly protein PilF
MAAGNTQEAIVEYRNAIQQDGRYGDARLKLAEAYEKVGNVNQASREYIRAADLLPQNDDAQIRAARYLIRGGRFEDARTRIQAVIDRAPTNVEAQLILGNALVGLKDLDGERDQARPRSRRGVRLTGRGPAGSGSDGGCQGSL